MSDFDETHLDEILINHDPQRKIIDRPGDAAWGQLIIPGRDENPSKSRTGIRMLLITSYRTGLLLLSTLIEYECRFPDRLNIVGLITDDPVSSDARISLKRRIWRLFPEEKRLDIEDAIIEEALCFGIPVFTGQLKSQYARRLLHHWAPDAIQVFVFGQIIDKPFINYPAYGIYNYHPADLKHHLGAGPRPYTDLHERQAYTSRFTIHQLSEELDAGHVVGQSPDINIRDEHDTIPENLLIVEDKMMEPLDVMTVLITRKLIEHHHMGLTGRIGRIDFGRSMPTALKDRLKMPIAEKLPLEHTPAISENALKLMQ